MELDLSILNQKGSPAIYQDIFANRPSAGFTGRLFVSTDTDELYRDNGTGWDLIGGGGGGAVGDGISILGAGTVLNPFNTGLDAVLAIGQPLSNDSSFKFNNKNVDFTGTKRVRFQTTSPVNTLFEINSTTNEIILDNTYFELKLGPSVFNLINANNDGIYFDSNYFTLFDFNVVQWQGLEIDFAGSARIGFEGNAYFTIGGGVAKTLFTISNVEKGIFLDSINDVYKFGDWDSSLIGASQSYLKLQTNGAEAEIFVFDNVSTDDVKLKLIAGAPQLVTEINGIANGLNVNFQSSLWQFGDYQGDAYFQAETAGNAVTIAGDVLNLNGSLIQSTPASGSSGDHLKITINGVNYVIDLLNP